MSLWLRREDKANYYNFCSLFFEKCLNLIIGSKKLILQRNFLLNPDIDI